MDSSKILFLSKVEIVFELLNRKFAQELKTAEIDLTNEQFRLLDILSDNEGIKQTELSNLLGRERATITRGLEVLEKKEYIVRKQKPEDNRSKFVYLTKKSKKALSKAQDIYVGIAKKSMKDIKDKEFDKADSVIEKLMTTLGE